MKLPIIETDGSLYGQLYKIEEEVREVRIELNKHPVDVDAVHFEVLDVLAAANNLAAMLNIPKPTYKKWVDKMNGKAYTIKEWR